LEEIRIQVTDLDILHKLFGNLDENVKLIEEKFDVMINSREGNIIIKGHDKEVVEKLLKKLIDLIENNQVLDQQKLDYYMARVDDGDTQELDRIKDEVICVTSRGKAVKPKTVGQKEYINTIKKNVLTFGIGPAGTGKTYLAVAMAVKAFKNKEVNRIVITRPAVEAGENLGFLPGDLQMKIDPYLRPLYDALYDILGANTYNKYKETGLIEVAPLAYMRGRTLDDSFIILDEAQNTTKAQMKMFLTRFGFGSKVVVNGDTSQIDLHQNTTSGLIHASHILKGVKDIGIVRLKNQDVVRHKLVKSIISRYNDDDKKKGDNG
jgi:phosphate starvation-inducible PhoH-like protein